MASKYEKLKGNNVGILVHTVYRDSVQRLSKLKALRCGLQRKRKVSWNSNRSLRAVSDRSLTADVTCHHRPLNTVALAPVHRTAATMSSSSSSSGRWLAIGSLRPGMLTRRAVCSRQLSNKSCGPWMSMTSNCRPGDYYRCLRRPRCLAISVSVKGH